MIKLKQNPLVGSMLLMTTLLGLQAQAQTSVNMSEVKFKEGKYQTQFHLEVKQNKQNLPQVALPKNKTDIAKLTPEQQAQLARQAQIDKAKPSSSPQPNLFPPKIVKKSICLSKEDLLNGAFMQKISDDNHCKTVVTNDGNKKHDFLIDVQCPEKFKLPGQLHTSETGFNGNYKMQPDPQSPLSLEANFTATRTGGCK